MSLDIYSNSFKEKLTLYKNQSPLRKMIESEQIRLSIKSMFLSQIYYLNKNDIESFKKHKNEMATLNLSKSLLATHLYKSILSTIKTGASFQTYFHLGDINRYSAVLTQT